MPTVKCPVPECPYVTADIGDAAGAVLLKFHLDQNHATPAPPAGRSTEPTPPKLQLDRPRIKAGATSDDWSHFLRDWNTYKEVCCITQSQAKKVIFECCDEDLKHLMYGQYTSEQQDAATEDQLIASLKQLAVVFESALTHRLRLGDAVQSPGQLINGFLATLKSLARPCEYTVQCTRTGCTENVDYSSHMIKGQLIRGMSDDSDRQRLLAKPDSEKMSLDQVVTFLHRLETSHRPIHSSSPNAVVSSVAPRGLCWRCGLPSHHSTGSQSSPTPCPASQSRCDRCQQTGHYSRCCPKCSDCQTQGHRSRKYRGCPKHKKPSNTPAKDETGVIMLCDLQTQHLHNPGKSCLSNHIFSGGKWLQKDNPPHSTVALTLTVGVNDHSLFHYPLRNPSCLHSVKANAAADSGAMALAIPLKTMHRLGLQKADLIPCKTRLEGSWGYRPRHYWCFCPQYAGPHSRWISSPVKTTGSCLH